jgi:hypothetical protein
MRNSSPFLSPLAVLTFVSCLVLSGCSGSEDDDVTNEFVVHNSKFAMAPSSALSTNGALLFFPASEAASGNQDLNNDGNSGDDDVAIVVNMPGNTETNLGLASTQAVWVGNDLYLVVDEVLDGRDHGGTTAISELVLMHWNSAQGTPMFVATLDRRSTLGMVSVGETLFFASDDAPGIATESSLYAIDAAFPHTPRNVFTQNATNGLRPRLIGEQDGLVLLTLSETYDNAELNGDGNIDDAFILALLDGTGVVEASGYNLNLRSTELAIESASAPMRAKSTGAHDWLLGFLVDEADQEVNLNTFGGGGLPSSWEPNPSNPCNDTDQTDTVLHAIRFAVWDADTMNNPPVNTGLAGNSRVLIAGDALATLCSEADENDCILNSDGDDTDVMLRWIRIDGIMPPLSSGGPNVGDGQMLALQTGLPGSAMSVAELSGAFVIQCSELKDGRDHDGNSSTDRNLIAWLDPQDGAPVWRFNHGTGVPFFATATWMAEQPGQTRVGLAFAESSNTTDLNDDGDMQDSMPTWAALSGGRMTFLGRFLAADKDNAGITLANGFGFFRFSEPEHNSDSNGNGNNTDILLVRVDFASGLATNMGILNTLQRAGIETDEDGSGGGGVLLFQENLIGTNLNGDGDTSDYVPRFFQLP